MQRTCLKCHTTSDAEPGHDAACPNCGAIYSKVAAQAQAEAIRQRAAIDRAAQIKHSRELAASRPKRKWITPQFAKVMFFLMAMVITLAAVVQMFMVPGAFKVATLFWWAFCVLALWMVVETICVVFAISEDIADCRDHLAAIRAQAEDAKH